MFSVADLSFFNFGSASYIISPRVILEVHRSRSDLVSVDIQSPIDYDVLTVLLCIPATQPD